MRVGWEEEGKGGVVRRRWGWLSNLGMLFYYVVNMMRPYFQSRN